MRGCVIIIFSLLLQNPLFGQSSFSGTVKDSLENSISNVNIIVYVDGILSHYTYSDNKGFHNLNINKSGDYSIAFSSIGFKSEEMKIYLDNRLKSKRTLDIILKKIPIELDQVVVKTKKPIIRKNDTIVFRTKFFLKGNEATVEELLKRIPDLNIDDDGTIKVGNKEIEKLMIDGDDLFGEGYKILSKNMPAYSVEEVELLKNYSKSFLFLHYPSFHEAKILFLEIIYLKNQIFLLPKYDLFFLTLLLEDIPKIFDYHNSFLF